jgi:ABC-type lipoprotein export system ATPase subunit
MKLLSLKNITKDYVNEEIITQVLRGVSIDIAEGEFVSIMGPSGSGKSTLMHIMGFLDRPTQGEFLFRGEKLQELTGGD